MGRSVLSLAPRRIDLNQSTPTDRDSATMLTAINAADAAASLA